MLICPRCQEEMEEIRSNSLISDLCEDCYEKEKYYTPDIEYPMPKRVIERTFRYTGGEGELHSAVSLLQMLHAFDEEVNEIIENETRAEGYLYAVAFNEYDQKGMITKFVTTGEIVISKSYFFANSMLSMVSNFEDRYKQKVLITINK